MYADAERHVRECVDCVTSKGKPQNPGPSPGNILATFPFEVLSMDFVIPLPESSHGNKALLLFQDTFSGYVLCKPMRHTTVQDVAEAYEEVVFRTWDASTFVRHDMDPRFMTDIFRHFNEMMGTKQRSTMAYRPQANGQQERSVQTIVKSIRAYVSEPDQSDWDDIVVKLMHGLNTSYDHTRRSTPAYLLMGWQPRSTILAMLGRVPRDAVKRTAYEWRRAQVREYEYARTWAIELQRQAKAERAEARPGGGPRCPRSCDQGWKSVT